MSSKKTAQGFKEIKNSKAFHKYFIGQKFEAGVVLQGTEVKSIRLGNAQITESFARIEKGNAILYHAYIDEYKFGNTNNHAPTRPRRLLLHRREIERIRHAIEAEGQTLIPIRIYLKGGLIKVELALCKGKKLHDKRESIKKSTQLREAERQIKGRYQ